MIRCVVLVFVVVLVGLVPGVVSADAWDVKSDTWVATDALGRSLPAYVDCGPVRSGKTVGIFYFLWLGQHDNRGPFDISKILAANPTDPQYGPEYAYHHWGESEQGYYLSDDEYVIRRHCEQLVDAGVDTIMLDVTNGFTYTSVYMKLCSVYAQIRSEGGKTPQICFLVNPDNNSVVNSVYADLYSQNLYSDLWFRWLGKPLILTKPDGLSTEIQNFFTFRKCWAWSHGGGGPSWWWENGQDKWTWLDHYPQWAGWHTQGDNEETSVCVAQHATTNIGRSFHALTQPATDQYKLCPTTGQGLCFAEQWIRALQINPQFLFVTGWNEWVAIRFPSQSGGDTFLGRKLNVGESYFIDEYNQEYSRDIEPMKGGHTDNYYYQMIGGIRKYKGVRPLEQASAPKTMTIDGDFAGWSDVGPEFRDTIGDTAQRNYQGYGTVGTYTNNTGRNDIKVTKVARDNDYVYFYAETRQNLTSLSGSNWMLLFIDSDRNASTGWQGYDYLVNFPLVSSTATTLKRNTGGWNWTLVRQIPIRVSSNKLELRIPRSDIGQTGSGIALHFHWADNIQKYNDITEFSVSGDSAPNRRANYRFDSGPYITNITSSSPNGTYKQGTTINIDVSFSDPVYVDRTSGTPRLELATGSTNKYAYCTTSSQGTTLTFTYTVANDSSQDLDYISSGALTLNGAVITNAYGINADLRLPEPGAPGSLGYNKDITVDGVRPMVTSVASTTPNGAYRAGSVIDIVTTFSEPVTVTGIPQLMLETGSVDRIASYISGAQSTSLTFRYDVLAGDTAADLNYKSTTSLAAMNASINDAAGNYALLSLPAPGGAGSLGSNADIVIDTTPPGATIAAPAGGVYNTLKSITLTPTEPAVIYYTCDGSEPTPASNIYSSPIQVESDQMLRFYAVDPAGNEETPKKQEAYTLLAENGSIATVKLQPNGSQIRLGGKSLYMKSGSFGYIEEPDRWSGIRIEGPFTASEGDLICLTGSIHTTPGGEKYILVDALTPCGAGPIKPVACSNKAVASALLDGLFVKLWGIVKPGSISDSSFILTDGSDNNGIKIATPGMPGIVDGQFVIITGAAGFDSSRVIYCR